MPTVEVPVVPITVVGGEYHRYRIGPFRNPKSDKSCLMIYDIKDANNKLPAALKHFGPLVWNHLKGRLDRKQPIVVAIVPSHERDKTSVGMQALVDNHLRPSFSVTNKINPLRRHTSVAKRATGGDRSVESVLNSVEVIPGLIVKGAIAILLDDITTTGGSFHACAHLLRQSGASHVECIALKQAVHD